MQVVVNTRDATSAESLRRHLARRFDASSIALDDSRTGTQVRLVTSSHAFEAITGALRTIEDWLTTDGIVSAELTVGSRAYVVGRHQGDTRTLPVEPEAGDVVRRPFRVLVVDDDPGVRMLCAVSLAEAGVEVLEAENGLRGLERARDERPDLVLLDVSMPILDGFGLAGRLRDDERTSDLPIVFLTGAVEPESRAKAYALGAAGFLTKPFDPGAVAALIVGMLTRGPGSPESQPA